MVAALKGRFSVRVSKEVAGRRTFFDTFDWRLYAARQTAEEIREGRAIRGEWRSREDDALYGRVPGKIPVFAGEWPPVARSRLAGVIKVRALLPLFSADFTECHIDLCDRRGKTVARINLSTWTLAKKGAQAGPLTFLRLAPLKGFEEEFALARSILENGVGLKVEERDSFDTALSLAGLKPLDYSSKVKVDLPPDLPAEVAIRAVLSNLSSTIAKNREGTIQAKDTEFLHDLRVAVRRTRSALGQLKGAIPKTVLRSFRPAFDRLGEITGPTRDMDVFLLKFGSYSELLEPQAALALLPLRAHIEVRRSKEQARLAVELKSKEFKNLLERWDAALAKKWRSTAEGWQGSEEIAAVAAGRIRKVHKRVVKLGALLAPQSPPEAVHELRIACKKLRYLMELFRGLFDAERVDVLVGQLKMLQDDLGDFQDYEVHRRELTAFAQELWKDKSVGVATFIAIGQLSERFATLQREARAGIGDSFALFGDRESVARFREVFAGDRERSRPDEGGRDV